ncbi:MAG: hypothetical protein H0Z29_00790 [Candidatus Marinimicrobia bacterium]|nr:hypothetical protein [Candidatus Neomarinimicrobiota bacterium]
MAKKGIVQTLDSIDEFEREPVPEKSLKGWKSFLGMYAGEHTAGTEFVIGPLFVAHGVTAGDLFLGLFLGNLLAVLSWAFLTAPIATRFRLTLYYMLEKIAGTKVVRIYNFVNALMFCFLAGAMISVSATAIGIPFHLKMPSLNDWLPTTAGWVVTVIIVGMATTFIAMYGYNYVSKFANIAAPWMILVFIAAAIGVLPELGVKSVDSFWGVAKSTIWTGRLMPGQSKFTMWHVMFFAWFCNMAMHIGMADLSILRYAKRWYQGFSSAVGMFIGHFIAWIASGILYALYLVESNFSMEFAPGQIAFRAAGVTGAICVVIAGLTTSNPTLYRAGLAIQSIRPKWKTWRVTLVVGLFTTLAACFPALMMKLLDFVAIYGLLLMPMGAVIFMDVYVIPRLKLKQSYAEFFNRDLNWAALLAWLITLGICMLLNKYYGLEVYFLGLPGWFIASLIYILGSKLSQKKYLMKGV